MGADDLSSPGAQKPKSSSSGPPVVRNLKHTPTRYSVVTSDAKSFITIRRTFKSLGEFCARTLTATRRLMETKNEFKSLANRSRWTSESPFLPATTDMIHHFVVSSPVSLRSSSRRSRRTAARTGRLRSLYSLELQPTWRSAARRWDMIVRVAAEMGGAPFSHIILVTAGTNEMPDLVVLY